ncbi:MAG: type II toxin-antitoxin system RelE/ParE family toxin [Patescibacteria group bacterium]|nr:type II toxin-antitoxin system RelE/ParE family toxin [Patescibacteria group bacterium]
MKYSVKFPTQKIADKFKKFLASIPKKSIQEKIMDEVEQLSNNPRPFSKKPFTQLKPPIQVQQYVARCRIRIGDYRVLYDVEDKKKTVWVYALRKRGEGTYK